MTNQTKLEKRIMRRIYCVFYTRKIFSLMALKLYLAMLLVWGIVSNVSFTNVYKNTMQSGISMGNISYFYRYAFMNTELIVQASTTVAVLFVLYALFNRVKSFTYSSHQRV